MASVVVGLARFNLSSLSMICTKTWMVPIIEVTSRLTSLRIMDFAGFNNVPHRRLAYVSWSIMVSEMIYSRGSLLGYLGEHKKSSSMVFA